MSMSFIEKLFLVLTGLQIMFVIAAVIGLVCNLLNP